MSIDMAVLTAREDVKTIAFHHNALDTIKAMCRHNEDVGETYGETSPEYLKQVRSFTRVMARMLNSGFGNTTYVTAEDPLSLYVQEGGDDGTRNYVFGIVFFRDRNYDGAPVQPGDWSVHS